MVFSGRYDHQKTLHLAYKTSGFPADFPWTKPVKKNAACLSLQSFQASVHFSGAQATLEEPIHGFQTEDLQDYVPRIEKGCFFENHADLRPGVDDES